MVEPGSAFAELIKRKSLLGVAWFTVWQAAALHRAHHRRGSAHHLGALPIHLPRAECGARRAARPFVLPTVVMGAAFLALAGPSGTHRS